MDYLGTQWTAELYGCSSALLDDVEGISDLMLAAAEVAHATIVGSRFHRFSPYGVSGVVIIAESHLAIHTWPEHGYAALDVFSCGETLHADAAFRFLADELKATHVEAVRQHRGAPDRIAVLREPSGPPLHPELLRYDEVFAARFLRPSEPRELAEQVYEFDLFTPEWCDLVVAECENHGRWTRAHGHDDADALSWEFAPDLGAVYDRILASHVRPTLERLWPGWQLQKWDAATLRHEARPPQAARPGPRAGNLTMVSALNDGFSGGGMTFPRWGLTVGDGDSARVGSVVVFPSGLSHTHAARPVTAGRKYTLSSSLH